METLQIIGVDASNYVWATRIAAEEKGVAYEFVSAAPHSPDVSAIHPLGKVPVMRHGSVTRFESRAIAEYIDQTFDGPALWPRDPSEANALVPWLSLVQTSIEPICVREYLFGYMFPGTEDGQPDRARIDDAVPRMQRALAVVAEGLEANAFGQPNQFTLVDAYLWPILTYLLEAPESKAAIEGHPAIGAYLARGHERPSVVATRPHRG